MAREKDIHEKHDTCRPPYFPLYFKCVDMPTGLLLTYINMLHSQSVSALP